ncbi:MAG: hypothetical protein LBV26_04840, partial [Bacteroidales bacterium]|nr:hypothetical protein [Bacteroidales bacterium]
MDCFTHRVRNDEKTCASLRGGTAKQPTHTVIARRNGEATEFTSSAKPIHVAFSGLLHPSGSQ